jgi:endonuclease/exonuclease/phosphatase family metal-dependent hydrolase
LSHVFTAALGAALLSLTSFVCAAIPAVHEKGTTTPLHVMTLNVRFGTAADGLDHWTFRKQRMARVLQQIHPDLIGLQEALEFQIRDLHEALPGYGHVGVGREDGKHRGEFSAIFYDKSRLKVLKSDTFWLSDTPGVAGSNTWGADCVRICTWAKFLDTKTGSIFYHFNTHLDHKSQPARVKGSELIVQRIASRETLEPVVLTGDFNAPEKGAAIAQVRKAGFRDTFRVVHPTEKNVGTTNGFKPTIGPNKIDYIFVDSSWKVLDAEIRHDQVDGRWITDHLPVTAHLSLP